MRTVADEATIGTEVLVVGSGAGGAPTAALLAEAGFEVTVLEEGAMVRQGEVVPFSLEQMDHQYRAGGVTAALGLPSGADEIPMMLHVFEHIVRNVLLAQWDAMLGSAVATRASE